jgi:hypothetical protein
MMNLGTVIGGAALLVAGAAQGQLLELVSQYYTLTDTTYRSAYLRGASQLTAEDGTWLREDVEIVHDGQSYTTATLIADDSELVVNGGSLEVTLVDDALLTATQGGTMLRLDAFGTSRAILDGQLFVPPLIYRAELHDDSRLVLTRGNVFYDVNVRDRATLTLVDGSIGDEVIVSSDDGNPTARFFGGEVRDRIRVGVNAGITVERVTCDLIEVAGELLQYGPQLSFESNSPSARALGESTIRLRGRSFKYDHDGIASTPFQEVPYNGNRQWWFQGPVDQQVSGEFELVLQVEWENGEEGVFRLDAETDPSSSDFWIGDLIVTNTRAEDISGDGRVDATDLAILIAAWGTSDADLNGDGVTDASDMAGLIAGWTG